MHINQYCSSALSCRNVCSGLDQVYKSGNGSAVPWDGCGGERHLLAGSDKAVVTRGNVADGRRAFGKEWRAASMPYWCISVVDSASGSVIDPSGGGGRPAVAGLPGRRGGGQVDPAAGFPAAIAFRPRVCGIKVEYSQGCFDDRRSCSFVIALVPWNNAAGERECLLRILQRREPLRGRQAIGVGCGVHADTWVVHVVFLYSCGNLRNLERTGENNVCACLGVSRRISAVSVQFDDTICNNCYFMPHILGFDAVGGTSFRVC